MFSNGYVLYLLVFFIQGMKKIMVQILNQTLTYQVSMKKSTHVVTKTKGGLF